MFRSIALMTAPLALLLLAGCMQTSQARKVERSGFLGDYSRLRVGVEGEPLMVFRNPGADFAKYDQILWEPVEIWVDMNSMPTEMPDEDIQVLADLLAMSCKERLAGHYATADELGPSVLRVRLALTEADKSFVPLDLLSTVYPQARVLSELKRWATGSDYFVGGVSAEIELRDGATGEILYQAADRRIGRRSTKGVFDSWSDVKDGFDHWAMLMSASLERERARPSS